ncbi:MAG: hypothetical protein A3I93_02435, partial [Candidatus Magasanikbacteria bacterium RIFCSPLOWO2_02_FULL_43_22]
MEQIKIKRKAWQTKTTTFVVGIVFIFLFFLLAPPVEAGNQQITFQGKLTNSSGNTVSNGTYYVKLTIYDAATGGSCQYTASSTCASVTSTPVTVTNGIFSINLGDTSASLAAISPTLFNSSALYLGITVCSGAGTGCDSEMTPRKRITAAPYAFNADYLSGLATSTIGGQGSYVPVTDSSGNLKISNNLFVASTTAGQFGVGTTTVPSGMKSYVESATASDKLLVIRGNSSQSGNLQEWQNSAGTALVIVDSSGNISTSGTLATFSNATIGGHLYPFSDNLYDVGASSTQWRYGNFQGGILAANGSTTSTLLNNSLTVGQASSYNSGKFNLDSSGNLSASGTIKIGNNYFSVNTDAEASFRAADTGNAFRIVNTAGASDLNIFKVDSSNMLILFDETNIGYKVGIGGTTNPSEKLTVIGNVASADGSTTSTLTKDSLVLGKTSTKGAGNFYVDSSGNVFATGSLKTFGNVTSTGNLYALSGTVSTSILNGSSLTLGSGTKYSSGMFNVSANGNVSASGSLVVFGDSANGVANISKSTVRPIGLDSDLQEDFVNASVLTLGNFIDGNGGFLVLKAANDGNSSIVFKDGNDGSIRGQLGFNENISTLQYVFGTGTVTSTWDDTQFILSRQVGFTKGKFFIDPTTGDTAASGTFKVFGNSLLGDSDAGAGDTTRIYGALAMGAAPTGNAQLFLKASSTTAVPFLAQDNNGNLIGRIASSSVEGIVSGAQVTVNGYALSTLGDASGLPGGLSIRSTAATAGAIILYRNTTAVGAQLTPGSLIVSGGGTGSTSTLDSLNFTVAQQPNYNQGVFYVNGSGNTSASGTLSFTATAGGVVSSTANTLRLVGTPTGTNNDFEFWDGLGISTKFLGFRYAVTGAAASTSITSYISNIVSSTGFVLNTVAGGGAMTSSSATLDRALLAVQNNGTNQFVVSAGGNVYADESFIANSTDYGIADMAEYVNLVAGETGEPGDVLVVDKINYNKFKKSFSANTKEVAGVISDTGAFIMGASGEGRAPLALAGLVKVKVTDENGSVEVGDYLTTASKPGYAMRFDADAGVSAGLVGMALEPLESGDGKVIILVNKGLAVGNSTTGQLNTSQNGSGQLVWGNDFNLHLLGRSILDVLSIKSQDEKWMIDEDGYLVVKVKTPQGDKELYGLQSGQDKEVVFSGSSQLENGIKKIELPAIDKEIVDINAAIKVSVTLTGDANGVFVTEKSYEGFTVKELNGGASNATFDWLVIAKRRVIGEETAVVGEENSGDTIVDGEAQPEEITTPEVLETPAESVLETTGDVPIEVDAIVVE